MVDLPLQLNPDMKLGYLIQEEAPTPITGATWYTGKASGDGLEYHFPPGTLSKARYLTADTLLDGEHLATFVLVLQEGESGPAFELSYGLLNQCSARIRMPLEAVNQNRWRYEREGAWLKPRCQGQRVNLSKVDRMRVEIESKSPLPVKWCLTPFIATADEPPLLDRLILPKGALLDELGQSRLHEWPGKSKDAGDVTARLRQQLSTASSQRLPEGFSRWGGWLGRRTESTGYFHTAQINGRWWLVDPDGYLFWSSGLDCVRVDTDACYSGLETALSWLPDPQGEYKAIYR